MSGRMAVCREEERVLGSLFHACSINHHVLLFISRDVNVTADTTNEHLAIDVRAHVKKQMAATVL